MIRFGVGQRRRRLVEDEDPAVEGERARHLQQLALRRRQRLGGRARPHAQVQLLEDCGGARFHLGLAQPSARAGQLAAGEDVRR